MLRDKKLWLVVALGLALGFVIFGNGLWGGFVYDDNIVLSNSRFNHPATFANFFTEPYFENFPEAGLYRPLTLISFVPNFLISGNNPFGFHFFNILLHIVNSILVYLLIFEFTKSFRISFLSFALFLVLPIHVEAISSIIGRAELLSFLFISLSFFLWLKSRFILSALLFLSALFAKETALALPPILLIISAYYKKDKKWIYYFVIAGFVYFILRVVSLGGYFMSPLADFVFNPLKFVSWGERIATSLKIFVLYLQKIFVPINLSVDYSYNQIKIVKEFWSSGMAIAGLLIMGLSIYFLAASIYKRKYKFIVIAIALFLFPYFIISNLILPTGTIMADRLMYWPSVGIIFLLAFLLDLLLKRRVMAKIIYFTIGGVIIVYSLLIIRQNKIWASEETLFDAMYQRSPDSVVSKTNWAKILISEGKNKEAGELLADTLQFYPDFTSALNLSAQISKNVGNLKETEKYLERALLLRPLNQETLTNLSRVYFLEKKYKQTDHILGILVPNYGGVGNIFLWAISKIKTGNYKGAKAVISNYFGNNFNNDESAKIIMQYADLKSGEFKGGLIAKKDAEQQFFNLESIFLGR